MTWEAGAGPDVLVDDVEQLLEVERLREVVVHAGVAEPAALPRRRVGREHDHRDVDGARVTLEAFEHFEAVEVREVDVEQNQVRVGTAGLRLDAQPARIAS